MPYDPTRHHRRTIRLRGYDYTQPGWYFVTICTHARRLLFDEEALRRIAEAQWHALRYAGARGAYGARVVIDAWVVMPNHVHGLIGITTPITPSVPRPSTTPADAAGTSRTSRTSHGGAQQPPHPIPSPYHLGAAAPLRVDDIVDRFDDIVDDIAVGIGGGDDIVDHIDGGEEDADGDGDGRRGGLGIGVAAGSLGAIVRSYKAAVARRINRRRRTPAARVWQRGYWERIIRDEGHLDRVRRYIAANPARWAADRNHLDALLARMNRKD